MNIIPKYIIVNSFNKINIKKFIKSKQLYINKNEVHLFDAMVKFGYTQQDINNLTKQYYKKYGCIFHFFVGEVYTKYIDFTLLKELCDKPHEYDILSNIDIDTNLSKHNIKHYVDRVILCKDAYAHIFSEMINFGYTQKEVDKFTEQCMKRYGCIFHAVTGKNYTEHVNFDILKKNCGKSHIFEMYKRSSKDESDISNIIIDGHPSLLKNLMKMDEGPFLKYFDISYYRNKNKLVHALTYGCRFVCSCKGCLEDVTECLTLLIEREKGPCMQYFKKPTCIDNHIFNRTTAWDNLMDQDSGNNIWNVEDSDKKYNFGGENDSERDECKNKILNLIVENDKKYGFLDVTKMETMNIMEVINYNGRIQNLKYIIDKDQCKFMINKFIAYASLSFLNNLEEICLPDCNITSQIFCIIVSEIQFIKSTNKLYLDMSNNNITDEDLDEDFLEDLGNSRIQFIELDGNNISKKILKKIQNILIYNFNKV